MSRKTVLMPVAFNALLRSGSSRSSKACFAYWRKVHCNRRLVQRNRKGIAQSQSFPAENKLDKGRSTSVVTAFVSASQAASRGLALSSAVCQK